MYPRLIVTPYFIFGVLLAAAYLASLWRLSRGRGAKDSTPAV
jgi:hypothetical protein